MSQPGMAMTDGLSSGQYRPATASLLRPPMETPSRCDRTRHTPTCEQVKLRNNEHRLPVEIAQLCDDAKEVSADEVERYDMVFAD